MAEPIWALGAMSGTSMDGVDAAMVRTDGHSIAEFGPVAYEPYSPDERALIAQAQGLWPGDPGVSVAADVVEQAHIRVLRRFSGAQVIGFHGQTLAHDPAQSRTHQAGQGRRLAQALGLPVVGDFRTADVALGGQGAPLAPFFHFALAKWTGAAAPIAFLNLGGIGNITWVDPTLGRPEDPGALLAFDTGPANAPIDDEMAARDLGRTDIGGDLALSGTVDSNVLARVMSRSYFAKVPPKSLDRGDFRDVNALTEGLSDADAVATLAALAAESVASGLRYCPGMPSRILVSGGGRHNRAIMNELSQRIASDIQPVEAIGLDGDMLEAQAFAYLAVRVKLGLPTSAPSTTGVPTPVGGGTLNQPR